MHCRIVHTSSEPGRPRAFAAEAIHARLSGGEPVCLRRIGPADEARMREGIRQLSPRSRYLRFFTGGASPPDWVIDRLLDVDGHRHLAWGALDTSADPAQAAGPAIGAVHAFRSDDQSGCAEFSVAVLDEWQGRGVGRLLTAVLLLEAQQQGIACLQAETLRENDGAIEFITALGGRSTGGDGHTRSFRLEVGAALDILRRAGEATVLDSLSGGSPAGVAQR